MAVRDSAGGFRIRGAFEAPVSPAIAWQVLTAYDSIGRFVGSIRESRLERQGESVRLRQVVSAGTFPFRRTMHLLLELHEDPGRSIAFVDRLGKDFHRYQGRWVVGGGGDRVVVRYELDADPRAMAPAFVGRGLMGRGARDLLAEVRAEMLRRAGVSGHPGGGQVP